MPGPPEGDKLSIIPLQFSLSPLIKTYILGTPRSHPATRLILMKPTYSPGRRFSSVEPLEARIAPASLIRLTAGDIGSTEDIEYSDSPFISTSGPDAANDPIAQLVGPGVYYLKLSTGMMLQLVNEASISPLISGDIHGQSGVKGNLIAFFVDKNGDNEVQANELVGLSLGNKVDVVISGTVDGDVVTNLNDSTFTIGGGTGSNLLHNVTGKLSIAGDVTGSIVSGGTISGVNVTGRVNNVLAGSAANGYTFDFNGALNPGGGETLEVTMAAKEKGVAITKSSFGSVTNIHAGDGGAGAVGGSVSLITIRGDQDGFTIQAGNGGNGSSAVPNGGAGGAVSSIVINGLSGNAADLTPNDEIIIRAGMGGDAITSGNGGKGGNGGSVQNLFVSYEVAAGQKSPVRSVTALSDEVIVEAGAGGAGRIGGAGGSLRTVDVFASPGGLEHNIQLIAGAGGATNVDLPSAKGGNGGSINGAFVLNPNISAEEGLEAANSVIILRGGAGGLTTSGKGGVGGSLSGLQLTGFAIDLGAGAGANGAKSAGNGGSLKKVLISDGGLSAQPENITINAGIGGSASEGKAGSGGAISDFRILNSDFKTLTINGALGAANGGNSAKGVGGKGGSVTRMEITESDSGNAGLALIRAGSGGNGGSGSQGGAGGLGGSVSGVTLRSVQLDLSVTAGDGGDAPVKGVGGKAGSVSQFFFSSYRQAGGTEVTATFTSGRGGDGAGNSAGGSGGDINRVNAILGREQRMLSSTGQISLVDGGAVTVIAGAGGASRAGEGSGTGAAGSGGSILSSNFTTYAGAISLMAGNAGAAGGKAGKGGRIESASLELNTTLTLLSGNGSFGGAGGDIKNIGFTRAVDNNPIRNFEATIEAKAGGSPLGFVSVKAGDGSGFGKAAGNGGSIIDMAGFVGAGALEGESRLSSFEAGRGGDGDTKAGNGGSINGLSLFGGGRTVPVLPTLALELDAPLVAEVRIAAGDAGNATAAKRGASGGNVTNVGIGVNVYDSNFLENPDNAFAIAPGTIIRHVAAGNGGDTGLANGRGGSGGSVTGLNAHADIGVRSGEGFGFSTMGGIFAGMGGANTAAPANSGVAGSVLNVTADAIATIVAGRVEAGDTLEMRNLANVVDRIILNGLENAARVDAVGNYTNFNTANILGGIVNPIDETSVPYYENGSTVPVMHPHANTFDHENGEFIDNNGDGVFGIGDTITAKTDGFVAAVRMGKLINVRAEAVLTYDAGGVLTFTDLNNTNGQKSSISA